MATTAMLTSSGVHMLKADYIDILIQHDNEYAPPLELEVPEKARKQYERWSMSRILKHIEENEIRWVWMLEITEQWEPNRLLGIWRQENEAPARKAEQDCSLKGQEQTWLHPVLLK